MERKNIHNNNDGNNIMFYTVGSDWLVRRRGANPVFRTTAASDRGEISGVLLVRGKIIDRFFVWDRFGAQKG